MSCLSQILSQEYRPVKYTQRIIQQLNQRLLVLLVLCVAFAVHAEDGDEENAGLVETRYIEVNPAFVTNFGGPGRLRYIKVEITLRVAGEDGEQQVNRHLPNIKDSLLNLFAIQTSDSISGAEGKEVLRQAALGEVSRVLVEEDEASHVEDLLFTSFVAHH